MDDSASKTLDHAMEVGGPVVALIVSVGVIALIILACALAWLRQMFIRFLAHIKEQSILHEESIHRLGDRHERAINESEERCIRERKHVIDLGREMVQALQMSRPSKEGE